MRRNISQGLGRTKTRPFQLDGFSPTNLHFCQHVKILMCGGLSELLKEVLSRNILCHMLVLWPHKAEGFSIDPHDGGRRNRCTDCTRACLMHRFKVDAGNLRQMCMHAQHIRMHQHLPNPVHVAPTPRCTEHRCVTFVTT